MSGMAKARNLKFGVRIEYDECYSKNGKLGDKKEWPRSRDLLSNFATPLYLRNGLKIHN